MKVILLIGLISRKDRKILYELDINSRQSFSSIGKKVGLHKNNVIVKGYLHVDTTALQYILTISDDTYISEQPQDPNQDYLFISNCNAIIKFDIGNTLIALWRKIVEQS